MLRVLDHRDTAQHNTSVSERLPNVVFSERLCRQLTACLVSKLRGGEWLKRGKNMFTSKSKGCPPTLFVLVHRFHWPHHFRRVFRPEKVVAATPNRKKRFCRVCVVLRGVAVVQNTKHSPTVFPGKSTTRISRNEPISLNSGYSLKNRPLKFFKRIFVVIPEGHRGVCILKQKHKILQQICEVKGIIKSK